MRWAWIAGIAFVLVAAEGAAFAQAASDPATAQALFEDGKKLMAQKKYDEACPKLVESERLDPGGGTVLAIALCHEAQGKTATAWAEFTSAVTAARADRRVDRERAAEKHVKTLEPKLVRVRLVVTTKYDGLEVRRDGAIMGAAQWGTPVPIDPGQHQFAASATGKIGWSSAVALEGEGKTIDVTVPAMDDAPVEAPPPVVVAAPAPVVPPPAPTQPPPAPPPPPQHSKGMLVGAIVAASVGVVGTGLGIGFGISAIGKWNDVKTECPNGRCFTPNGTASTGPADQHSAGKAADASTLFFVVGGLGLVTGAILYVLKPNDDSRAGFGNGMHLEPMVGRGTGGLSFGGSL